MHFKQFKVLQGDDVDKRIHVVNGVLDEDDGSVSAWDTDGHYEFATWAAFYCACSDRYAPMWIEWVDV